MPLSAVAAVCDRRSALQDSPESITSLCSLASGLPAGLPRESVRAKSRLL